MTAQSVTGTPAHVQAPSSFGDSDANESCLHPFSAYHFGMAFERITVDPNRMGGVPCIRDLRVTVGMVLGQLAGGRTIEEVLVDYPYLERADVLAALEYASVVVNEREVPVARPA